MKIAALVGQTVTFNDKISDNEGYAEPGMKAKIVWVIVDQIALVPEEEVFKFEFDFSEFEDHNQQYETSNFWGVAALGQDPNSATYSARETNKYQQKETHYLPGKELWDNYFTLDSMNPLIQRYLKEQKGSETYVAFLERLVTESNA